MSSNFCEMEQSVLQEFGKTDTLSRIIDLFQDADCAGYGTGSKSTSGGMLCIFGDHTFYQFQRYVKNRRQCRTAAQ